MAVLRMSGLLGIVASLAITSATTSTFEAQLEAGGRVGCASDAVYTRVEKGRSELECGLHCQDRDTCKGYTFQNDSCGYFNFEPTFFVYDPPCATYFKSCDAVYTGVDPAVSCLFPFISNGVVNYRCTNINGDHCTTECLSPTYTIMLCDPTLANYTLQPSTINNGNLANFPLIALGPWVVIQNRPNPQYSTFKKTFAEYESGFLLPNGDYWVGLTALYLATNASNHILRFEVKSLDTQQWYYADYADFWIDSPINNYKIHFGAYTGDATNGLKPSPGASLNGHGFFTNDRPRIGCEHILRTGGWWVNQCSNVNLNSDQETNMWQNFPGGNNYKVAGSRMMMRAVV